MKLRDSNLLAQDHFVKVKLEVDEIGFSVVNDIYTQDEVSKMLAVIANLDTDQPTFRKSGDLFAIRQFLKGVPEMRNLVFNDKLKILLTQVFSKEAFVVKSIYFDKPEKSNWYVAYHQDLTISVDKKVDVEGFGPWTVKHEQFAVQPPLAILERNFTLRIHLDQTNDGNGALKVIPRSHLKGIYRPETIDWSVEEEIVCEVESGGVMLMKPLILHSSSRTTNGQKRRVIHIEFSSVELPVAIQWSEKLN